MIPQQLLDQTVRHAVHLERLKSGQAGKYQSFLREIDRLVREVLGGEELTDFQRRKMNALLSDTRNKLEDIHGRFTEGLQADLFALAAYEAGFEAQSIGKVVADVSFTLPSEAQLIAAVNARPLSLRSNGKKLKPFIADWSRADVNRVTDTINQGFYEGQTNAQIRRAIRGTVAARFKDGLLGQINRHAEAITRTAVQHVATVARNEVYAANSDIITGYEWVSTLDSRTSQQCRSLDGQTFKPGKGPLPPIHINCRSTTVPVLDDEFDFLGDSRTRASRGADGAKQVKDQSYYEWLKRQPKSFQVDTIGKARTELLRNGGLTAKEFARLNIDKTFNPLSLDEMRSREPLAFERAGL